MMEVSQESQVNFEEGGDIVSGLTRKAEPLYKVHKPQFLRIFPEEVWEMILGELKNDPDGQTNCANASPYFWELLKKDRRLFLFPKVIEIMARFTNKRRFAMHPETAEKNGYNPKAEEHDFWTNEETKAWRASVLSCRPVCSVWNKAVEQCFQSVTMSGIPELFEGSLDSRSAPRRNASTSWTHELFQIRGLPRLRKFISQFQESHFSGIDAPPKNPVFGRWLVIQIDAWTQEDCRSGVTQLLELIGREIWYCRISWTFLGFFGKEFASELANWLGLMPNLRYLNLQGPEKVTGLSKKDFQLNSIPKLEKLEMLELDDTNGLIIGEMLRANSHVKVVSMFEIYTEVDSEVGRLLGNLKHFSARPSVVAGNEMLDEFGHHWSQLNKLDLCHCSKYFGNMVWNWANTLTELELRDPFKRKKATILRKSKNLRLNLHNIRRLYVEIQGLFYLDFIRPMQKSLEHLEISGSEFEMGNRKRVKHKQSIELVGFEKRMNESNIWKLFGKLKTIKMDLGVDKKFLMFSREGGNYLCIFEEGECYWG